MIVEKFVPPDGMVKELGLADIEKSGPVKMRSSVVKCTTVFV